MIMMLFSSSDKGITKNDFLQSNWDALEQLVLDMMKIEFNKRPSCSELLSEFTSTDINIIKLKDSTDYHKIKDQMKIS